MTAESKPFLGRCKQCDYAVFATEEDLSPAADYKDVLPGGAYRLQGRGVLARCTNNHRVFPLKRIEGTFSEDFKCDSRCLNARGRKCTCSCGGMNHGRGHAVQVQPISERMTSREVAEQPAAERRLVAEQTEAVRNPKQHIGEIGEQVFFTAKLDHRRLANDTVLYVFLTEVRTPITDEYLGEAKVEWWKPDWLDDPEYVDGEVYKFKAKVKRHDDNPKWGKATVVTYLEEV
jgi:hypothetical protein